MSFKDAPIQRKLMLILLLTSIAVMLAMRAAFFAYEFLMFRQATVRQLSTLGAIIADNSTAALAFQNQDDAQEILAALKAERHIVAACVYDQEGRLFSRYPADLPADAFPGAPGSDGYRFERSQLAGFQPVIQGGNSRLGTVYLKFDAGAIIYEWLGGSFSIALGVMVFILLAAYPLAKVLQHQISQPILALAETAKAISDRQDYSVRATKRGDDELGLLTDAFNHMLTQIHAQNVVLKESEARLQTVVENLVEGIAVSDLDGHVLHFNRAALDLHGFASLEECRRHLTKFADLFELAGMDGTVWPVDQWPLARILRGEPLRHLEARIRRTDADWERVFSYGGTLVRDASGRPIMAIVTITDITERKQSEAKLQAQLSRLDLLHRITRAISERQDLPSIFQVIIRSLEDNLPIDFGCVCLYDPVSQILTVNRVGVKSGALAMELAMTEQAHIAIDQNGLSRCVNGELVYEPDLSEVPFPFAQRLTRGGLRSLVAAPLVVESKVFGVLVAARREGHSFSSPDCEFLRQLSEQVALAAHQAQLYGSLQQAYDELRQS